MEMRIRNISMYVSTSVWSNENKHDVIPLITTPQLHIAIAILHLSLQMHGSSNVER